jgi:hypothetical protein
MFLSAERLEDERRRAAAESAERQRTVERLAHRLQVLTELKYVAPDWRHSRPTLGPAWGQLLRQQPELAPELTKRREAIIVSLFNTAPPEYQRAIQDLRKLFDLALEAHGAAAYQVGFAGGRLFERTQENRQRQVERKLPRDRRLAEGTGLRLTLAE